ncbi:MAG: gamma-glutamyltransferase [Pseudomonadota bacterium]
MAYADMLRYVADPKFETVPVLPMLSKAQGKARAALIDPEEAACDVEPSKFNGLTEGHGGDTIYLSVIDREGNIVSLIQSLYSLFGSGITPPGTGVVLQNRGALFTLEDGHPNQIAPRKRPLHTIIPAFMEKGPIKIGFGIMGGSIRRRRTRSLSPISRISVSMCSRPLKPAASPRAHFGAAMSLWRRLSPRPPAGRLAHSATMCARSRRAPTPLAMARP